MNEVALLLTIRRLLIIAIVAALRLFLMGCSSMLINKSIHYASIGLHQSQRWLRLFGQEPGIYK